MHQAILGTQEVHKRAELRRLHDLAVIDLANLGLRHDPLDHVDRLLARFLGRGCDLDRTVILDVDLGATLGHDLTDHLAAGADHVADLLLRHLDDRDARGRRGHVAARTLQGERHFTQNVQPPIPGLCQRDFHDVGRDGRDLDVHLQARDATLRPGDLEVHVAQEILVTENVAQHRKAAIFLDQTHRDARHRPHQRHARIHQRQAGAAHGRHAGAAVALRNLGHHAHRVRKHVLGRQHWAQRAVGELAMPYLTPARAAHAASLADAVGREVVMQHEMLPPLPFERVDHLLILPGA